MDAKRTLLAMVKPGKSIAEMTDQELDALAAQIAELASKRATADGDGMRVRRSKQEC